MYVSAKSTQPPAVRNDHASPLSTARPREKPESMIVDKGQFSSLPPLQQDRTFNDDRFAKDKNAMQVDPKKESLIPLLKEKEKERRKKLEAETQISTDGMC